jgi:hypothetical protein
VNFVFFVLLAACSKEEPPERSIDPPIEPDTPPPPPARMVETALEGLEDPVSPDEVVHQAVDVAGQETIAAATPERGCATITEAPVRVWPRGGPTRILAVGDRFVIAGHAPREGGGEDLFLVVASPESQPMPVRTVALDAPMAQSDRTAEPALTAVDDHTLFVAAIDAHARIVAGHVDLGDVLERLVLTQIAEGADTRFPPVARAVGSVRAVAWTRRGASMTVELTRVEADLRVDERIVVSPPTMGGTAPAFVAGSDPPELVFIDARAGISPLVRVPLNEDGMPGEARVARPIGTAATHPDIAAAFLPDLALVAFAAVGNMATTAIGVVRVDDDSAAQPLVPGTGYGDLSVDAARGGASVVFVATAPQSESAESPRVVRVRRASSHGLDEPLELTGPDGSANYPSIARRADGTYAVSFTSSGAIHVAWLRCAD